MENPLCLKLNIRICLITVHTLLIGGLVVFLGYVDYCGYRENVTRALGHRYEALYEPLYRGIERFREETGTLPTSLESFFTWADESGHLSEELKSLIDPNMFYPDQFEYRITDGRLVLIDLGEDMREGGRGNNTDVTYPITVQGVRQSFPFLKSGHLMRSIAWGIPFALAVSLCLSGIWAKGLPGLTTIGVSVAFLAFECLLAFLVVVVHVNRTH